MQRGKKAIVYAVTAAALYALNSPLSKLLLDDIPPTMMAGFLYLGAGIGMFLFGRIRNRAGHPAPALGGHCLRHRCQHSAVF